MEIVKMLKALSDENRIEMVKLIIAGTNEEDPNSLCGCHILENFNFSQPTCSHHTKILVDAKIVSVEKKGKYNYYSVNDEAITFIQEFIGGLR